MTSWLLVTFAGAPGYTEASHPSVGAVVCLWTFTTPLLPQVLLEVRESAPLSRGAQPSPPRRASRQARGEGCVANPSSLPLSLPARGLGWAVERGRAALRIQALGHWHLTTLPLKTQPAAPAMDRWYLGECPEPRLPPPSWTQVSTPSLSRVPPAP